MELPIEYPELTDHNLASFADKWEQWDRLAVAKCVKEIKPKHIHHLTSCMRKLKFTNLNTFRNLKTLLNQFPHVHTLLFYDACFDQFKRNKSEKMVFHEGITHIVITSTTTLATKEHWIIEFLMEEVNFPNLISFRIQKFYSLIPLVGEVEEIMQKYLNEMDDNLVTKFLLKNRHCLREVELGGAGLRMAVKSDGRNFSTDKTKQDENVMTETPVYLASAVQYDLPISTSKALQSDVEEKISTEAQYEFVSTLADAETEDFKRPLEKFIARLKARREKEHRVKKKSSSDVEEIYVADTDGIFNSQNSVIASVTMSEIRSEQKIPESCPCLKSSQATVPDDSLGSKRLSCPCVGEPVPAPEKKSKSKSKKRKSRTRDESNSSTSSESEDEKSNKKKEERNKNKEETSKSSIKTLTDFEKVKSLNLETFIFSFDVPTVALKTILESQRNLKVLMCTHVFILQGLFNVDSLVDVETVTGSIIYCVRQCEETLTEITIDPTLVIDASHETLKESDYLKNFLIDCKIFKNCTALKIVKLGLHAFRRVHDLGIPSLAILMGTRLTSMQRIPYFQLEELSLSLEDYSRDEFEGIAKNFGSFVKLRRFYFGTSTLNPVNTFMIRYEYLFKLFHLPTIQSIMFHNAKLENPEQVKTLVDAYPNGAVITINFDFMRISFDFDRSYKKS